jgi:midasin
VYTGVLHPSVSSENLNRMVDFLHCLHRDANVAHIFAGSGGPWEFNLRDLLRWCELAEGHEDVNGAVPYYGNMLFMQRLRSFGDRLHAAKLWQQVWGEELVSAPPAFGITPEKITVGMASIARHQEPMMLNTTKATALALLPSQLPLLEYMNGETEVPLARRE